MVGGERGFVACSLDMGQEINGTSNTNANSVSRAAHTAHAYNSQSHAGMFGIVDERTIDRRIQSRNASFRTAIFTAFISRLETTRRGAKKKKRGERVRERERERERMEGDAKCRRCF